MTQNKTNLSEFSVAQFKNAGKEKKVWNDQEQTARCFSLVFRWVFSFTQGWIEEKNSEKWIKNAIISLKININLSRGR